MSAIKPHAKVMARGIPFVLTVDRVGRATDSGPVWECTWKNRKGNPCRRAFLEASLTPAPTKRRAA